MTPLSVNKGLLQTGGMRRKWPFIWKGQPVVTLLETLAKINESSAFLKVTMKNTSAFLNVNVVGKLLSFSGGRSRASGDLGVTIIWK